MHTGNNYTLKEFLYWTRDIILYVFVLGLVTTVLFQLLDWHWLAIPWVPIALIGTAAAFIVGFKNTQTYNRLWEARQIYGAIVNGSRSWGMLVKAFVNTETKVHQQLIYRHIAWLTALRFQLREIRSWENTAKPYNKEYRNFYIVPERETKLEEEIKPYLAQHDFDYAFGKKNRATHIISLQSKHLKALNEAGSIEPLHLVEMENLLVNLFEQQGRCERIKNFPYPRQFASINLFFIHLFVFVVPFGLLQEFQKLGDHLVWLNIPFTAIVGWVFLSMERVGESTENPFEGGANDVPITALSRTIEIDLREMLDETDLPAPYVSKNNILM